MKKAIAFAFVLLLSLSLIFHVLSPKFGDGIYSVEKFYELPKNSLDVLVLGSSHAFENINPAILWQTRGIAGYDLCGSDQPMWNTYHFLREALKTQKPKLVVVEVFQPLYFLEEYSYDANVMKNTFGLRFSLNKIEAVIASTPKGSRLHYLLEFPLYHARYNELVRGDFAKDQGNALFRNFMGFGTNFGVMPLDAPEDTTGSDTLPLYPKCEDYLLRIIRLCQERNLPLLFVAAPFPLTDEYRMRLHTIERIAEENGVPLLDYNSPEKYREIGLDFATDFADEDHMNDRGNVKLTTHLANYIAENYTIPDRRGDAAYEKWDASSLYYTHSILNHYREEERLFSAYLTPLDEEHYRALIYLPASFAYRDSDRAALLQAGFTEAQLAEGGYYTASRENGPLTATRISTPYPVDIGLDTYVLYGTHKLVKDNEEILIFTADQPAIMLFDFVTETLTGYGAFLPDADGMLKK